MTKRERDKKASLDALAKFAYSVGGGAPTPPPRPAERASSLPPPPPRPKVSPPPAPRAAPDPAVERARRAKLEERRAKLEEERRLRERRAGELARSTSLQWRGMSIDGIPTGIRRTAFDRVEPSVSQKIQDVLGDPAEKEGRAKNRDKGRRQGGR